MKQFSIEFLLELAYAVLKNNIPDFDQELQKRNVETRLAMFVTRYVIF